MTPRHASVHSTARVERLAAHIVAAHRTGVPFDPDTRDLPASLAEAYAVQDRVTESVWPGERVTAWKTGGPHAQATPIAAPIPASRVLPHRATFDAGGAHVVAVEAELAYRFGRDLPARDRPYDFDEIAAAVASMHVAIEVCTTRLRDWRNAATLAKLADHQMNGALVIGNGVVQWRDVQPQHQAAEMDVNGERVGAALGSHPYGDPVSLLPWLVAHCGQRCGGLRVGDVVTTGAWTGMHVVAPGALVRAAFPGIGEALVTVAPQSTPRTA